MDSKYNFNQTEDKIYKLWEKADAFNPDSVKKLRQKKNQVNSPTSNKESLNAKPFSIIMPPPNANDPLHVGHAIFVALEDIMVRYHRMLGDDTVWIPGTDHAGIETQFVFEQKLKKKGQSRFNFDRSTLFNMIWAYVQENSGVAVEQIKKLGASADWSRFKFTLDKDIVDDVLETFKNLHKNGLIYRDFKLVNYCTRCGTSYSELEVNHTDKIDPLYTIQYGPLQVSTVRPETIFGDVAVAVNPEDSRYQKYIGKQIEVEFPWGKKSMPVIADSYVDPKFGTGAVKVTPYHDPNDFQMWETHKKEIFEKPVSVINISGKIQNSPKKYNGLGIVNARKAVVENYETYKDSKGNSLLIAVDKKYSHSVGTCYRCNRLIEPLPLPQLFLRVADNEKNLVNKALKALESGETKIHGAGREKILKHWLKNLKDWNISRQIVWGISIPIWYEVKGNEDKITVTFIDKKTSNKPIENKSVPYKTGLLSKWLKEYSLEEIKQNIQSINADISVPYSVSIEDPGSGEDDKTFIQETDTFDTWFSSSQWPVVTLKNTGKAFQKNNVSTDFERFYPTSVMETGYDILPIWVMRMMLLGIYTTDKSPFKDVYLHGLVRDEKGLKMSKSKGNVINPIAVKEEFGADALRMALVIRSTPGQDKSVGIPDFKAARNLTNKIWNAARFTMMMIENPHEKSVSNNAPEDKKYLEKLNSVITEVTKQLDHFKIGLSAETIYNEFWHWFCDICIEDAKQGKISLEALNTGLIVFLKLIHPFMPFVTEEIWQELVKKDIVSDKLLIVSDWPTPVSYE
jgi:valyl-tRNA synthetase